MSSSEAELVAIYGRRRVGKTFLIRELLGENMCFELTGVHGASLREQLANFATALAATRKSPRQSPPATWAEAFEQLSASLGSPRRRKQVVFLDEMPWLASARSGFLRAFEHFWNTWAVKRRDVVVIVSGSAAAWMVDEVLNARGGLHNRVTRRIRLDPFTVAETEQYFQSRGVELGRFQLLELYAALGGIPFYLRQVERGESASVAIDRLCFAHDGVLRDEFDKLYASLFDHPGRHIEIVRALGSRPHGVRRADLLVATRGTSGGRTSQTLEELEQSGFVMRVPEFGQRKRDAVFRLIDEYSLFYLKWIENFRGRAANIWINKRGTAAWRAWSGYAFEGICLKHVGLVKRALGIEAVETVEAAWHHRPTGKTDRGAQIDLVIDRKDASMNLCEMKFSEGEFVIDKQYSHELRHKRDAFRRITDTSKALVITMVTTNGVKDNVHARDVVDKQLTMDALFAA